MDLASPRPTQRRGATWAHFLGDMMMKFVEHHCWVVHPAPVETKTCLFDLDS